MTMRIPGIFLTALGALAATGEICGRAFPTVRWFFQTSRDVPWLHLDLSSKTFPAVSRMFPHLLPNEIVIPWFGWLSTAILIVAGLTMVVRSWRGGPRDPVTEQRIRRFRAIKRGYVSLLILLFLGGLAGLDQIVVGKRALAVNYAGKWSFPAFLPSDLKNEDFGITGERAQAPADYRELKRQLEHAGTGRVIMPPIPYDPTGDTLPIRSLALVQRDGVYYESGASRAYSGMAANFHDVEKAVIHLRFAMRNATNAMAHRSIAVSTNTASSSRTVTPARATRPSFSPCRAASCARSNTTRHPRCRAKATGWAPPPRATMCWHIFMAACR